MFIFPLPVSFVDAERCSDAFFFGAGECLICVAASISPRDFAFRSLEIDVVFDGFENFSIIVF